MALTSERAVIQNGNEVRYAADLTLCLSNFRLRGSPARNRPAHHLRFGWGRGLAQILRIPPRRDAVLLLPYRWLSRDAGGKDSLGLLRSGVRSEGRAARGTLQKRCHRRGHSA